MRQILNYCLENNTYKILGGGGSNEFERLKEFGVTAKKDGDLGSFTFQGVTTEVQNSSKAIQDYILSLGKVQGVSGSMASQMNTMTGKFSNLQDTLLKTKLAIGAAFSPIVIEALTTIIAKVE
jgi:hypothetical protein